MQCGVFCLKALRQLYGNECFKNKVTLEDLHFRKFNRSIGSESRAVYTGGNVYSINHPNVFCQIYRNKIYFLLLLEKLAVVQIINIL